MDELLRKFAQLVFNIAREIQNDGYLTSFRELIEEDQTFFRDVLQRRLPDDQLDCALIRSDQRHCQIEEKGNHCVD